jgi:hypothetical protein
MISRPEYGLRVTCHGGAIAGNVAMIPDLDLVSDLSRVGNVTGAVAANVVASMSKAAAKRRFRSADRGSIYRRERSSPSRWMAQHENPPRKISGGNGKPFWRGMPGQYDWANR